MKLNALLLAALLTTANLFAESATSPRERLSLDANWKFHLGNEWGWSHNLGKAGSGSGPASESFSDASWRTVTLPHDWALELPFDQRANESHGFHAVGREFPENSVAWYRRTFELPKADDGQRIWLEFDGVYRDTVLFVNGYRVGRHESGYSGFRFDITDLVHFGGKNFLAVQVDATKTEGWWYEGAGIYRHVWLVKTAPIAFAPDGVFVHTLLSNAEIKWFADFKFIFAETNIYRFREEKTVELNCEIHDPNGKLVIKFPPDKINKRWPTAGRSWGWNKPATFWSPESPKLYKLVATIEDDGKVVDRVETSFGIRTVAFDADKGFLLNGKPYVLKGTCNHQDHAGLGVALPDAMQYFRIAKLKEMGCNAYRCSHNPPTPELLEACDRLGMLVLDENRVLGSDAENLDVLERLVRRDRNHPSVFAWSLANEENVQNNSIAGRVAVTMQDRVKSLDPTRPVTYASHTADSPIGINRFIEVRGWNYHLKDVDTYRTNHPTQPQLGTEQGSTVSTRGIYENDKTLGYVSAYDTNFPGWAATAETWWTFFDARPWLSGGFVWTGFDYRGEPTPYGWPCINSHFGILDMCGFPKDNFWYYQSWWTTNVVLHLLPHWNWPGKEGTEIRVDALSNCEEVELFLNGASLGKQPMKRNSKLSWLVKYAPGVLSAKGFNGGKVVAENKVETVGAAAAIQLTPDRATINADGEDVSVFTVAVTDAQGRVAPTAMDKINFTLTGAGKILGVGNGDPSSHEPDLFLPFISNRVVALDDWRWANAKDVRSTNVAEYAVGFDDSAWKSFSSTNEAGPLEGDTRGVFRAHLALTEADLAAAVIEIKCGSLHGHGYVWVNGQRAGMSQDQDSPAVFGLKKLLHVGDNVIAIGILNREGSGGVNKGVSLLFQQPPVAPQWSRRVFNGLAQIIVQSTRDAGEIQLTASADGLKTSTATIVTKPAPLRPSLP